MEYTISDKVRAWGKAESLDVEMHLDAFNDYLANRTKKPYKNLDAAFRNCVRSDWFGLRKQSEIKKKYNPEPQKRSEVEKFATGNMAWREGGWVMAND
jgi:hypothetical protein